MKNTEKFEKIRALIPSDGKILWTELEETELGPIFKKMRETDQNPEYHAEGNVYTHTKMVCEALIKEEGYLALGKQEKEVLFLAALLHDIGKIRTTRLIDGRTD